MTSEETFTKSMSDSAKDGRFDRTILMSQACDLTRDLRDQGATPESTLISVKQILDASAIDPPRKLKEEIVTHCIETFFEK